MSSTVMSKALSTAPRPAAKPAQRAMRCQCHALAPPQEAASTSAAADKEQVVSYEGVEFVVDEDPELKSTWGQRAIVGSSALATAALLAQGVTHSNSVVATGLAMLAGFIFADFGSGIYHWSVDNYGSGATPVVGSQIAAFQGHHQRPWTITQREFCNNCSLTFKPAGIAAALFLVPSLAGATPALWDTFAATAIFFIAMSQQLHAWSHMKPSQLSTPVMALQDAGLIISRKAHGAHHRSPFNINYCIVSGWCNPILDSGLMFNAEMFVKERLGVEPRGWSAPSAEWRELQAPEHLQ